MVSDERRQQLNYSYFTEQVQEQWQAYRVPRPDPLQLMLRKRLDSTLATLESALTPGSRVLDIGCGVGELAGRLAERGYQVTAVDMVPQMIDRARSSYPQVAWINAPFTERLDVEKGFDAAVVLGYLEFQERAGKELARIKRYLKPGGLLILSVPNTLSTRFGFGLGRALYRLQSEPEDTLVRHSFTPERLQRLLGMAGFILMDYAWLHSGAEVKVLGKERQRLFLSHRLYNRLKPELLTLSRTYVRSDSWI